MKPKNVEELVTLVQEGVIYLKYDYEECVFKIVSKDKDIKEAWVKFPGERPYRLRIDSRLLYEAMLALDVICEQEFQDY
jgi:hypothetical protein